MELTTITIRYGRTFNLGNYHNTKPEVELTATIGDDEIVETVQSALFALARRLVEEQIDRDLEAQGDPAHFSRDPRYSVITSRGMKPVITPPVLAIVPAGTPAPAGYRIVHDPSAPSEARAHIVLALAQRLLEQATDTVLYDLRAGDMHDLPAPPAPPEPDPIDFF